MKKIPDYYIGIIYICISAFAYATQTILGKYAFQAGLTPESLLLLRYAFTIIILTPLLLVNKGVPVFDKSPLVLIQSLLFVSEGLLFFYSLTYLPATITVVVFFSHPVLVAIISALIFKERLQLHFTVGLTLAVAGVALVSGVISSAPGISAIGLILTISAAFLYAFYSIASQRSVRSVHPLTITNTMSAISVVFLLMFFHDISFIGSLNLYQVSIALIMTVVNTIIAVVFFLKAVQKIGASRATLLGTLEPVLAMFLACLLLKETLSAAQLLGSILVFTSIILAIYPSRTEALPSIKQEE